MDTLTRVMSRYVYNINLHDLPLDRLTERKQKKAKGVRDSDSELKIGKHVVDGNIPSINRPRCNSGSANNSFAKVTRRSDNVQTNLIRSRSDSQLFSQKANQSRKHSKDAKQSDCIEKSRSLECMHHRIDCKFF